MRSGVFTALVLVFVETVKEMPATLLLRPFGLDTLAVEVWERTAESQWTEASIPALAIVAAGLLPVFLAIRFSVPLALAGCAERPTCFVGALGRTLNVQEYASRAAFGRRLASATSCAAC